MTIFFKTLFGSHLYGTDTPKSDRDYKAIYMPAAEDILLQRVKRNINQNTNSGNSKNTNQDEDFEIFSLGEFAKLLLESQTVAYDMLFAPEEFRLDTGTNLLDKNGLGPWEDLQKNKHKFLCKQTKSFIGYAVRQAAKYGIKGSRLAAVEDSLCEVRKHSLETVLGDCAESFVPALIEKHGETGAIKVHPADGKNVAMLEVCGRKIQYSLKLRECEKMLCRVLEIYGERSQLAKQNLGVDWKALSHAVRCMEQVKEFFKTSHMTLPLKAEPRALVLAIKKGEMSYLEVAAIIESGYAEIEELALKSTLPEKPDYGFADEFVCKWYGMQVINS